MPSPLKALANFLRLLHVFIAGAPEQHATRHAPDGDGDIQLAGDAQEIVSHPLLGDLRAQPDADRVIRQRLNLLP